MRKLYQLITETIAPVPRPAAALRPVMTRCEWSAYWALFGGGFFFALWISLASTGYSLDDEITHYLRSHQAWSQPERLLGTWTRPGRNFIHFFFAWMSLESVRVATLLMAAVVVWVSTKIAAGFGLRRLWLLPLFLWFQPWFISLSGAVLTQTPFALVAVLGIYWLLTGKDVASGFCWGYLSLIRHEGIAFSLMFFVWFAVQGRWRGVLGVLAPIGIYNLIAYLSIGEIPLMVFFEPKPEGRNFYGTGTLFHFVPTTFWFASPVIVVLSLLGLPKAIENWRSIWPLIVYPLYWLMHTIIYWRGLFASGGYYEFLMPMAPVFAIGALYGMEQIRVWTNGRVKLQRVVLAVVMLGIVVPVSLTAEMIRGALQVVAPRDVAHLLVPQNIEVRPYQRAELKNHLDEAIHWVDENRPSPSIVLCANIYIEFTRALWKQEGYGHLHYTRPSEQELGTVLLWEEAYSDVTFFQRAYLQVKGSGWVELQRFGSDPEDPAVVIYEKVSKPTLTTEETGELLKGPE